MEAIAEAARKARYNETIVVNVTEENQEETREILLTATLDEQGGGVVWNDAALSSNGRLIGDEGIVRHLRTKRWIAAMLNDRRRNDRYDEAILCASKETLRRFKSQKLPLNENRNLCIRALDIGTGTGLLAMMTYIRLKAAAEAEETNSPKVHITSLEMASAMARLAKLTIESNGLQDSIDILEEHSCEANFRHKFMMCTSELLETGLLGEGILPSLRDAWQRHLHPDAVVVPQKARVYAQLVESKELVGNFRGPHAYSSSDDGQCSLQFTTQSHGRGAMLSGNVVVPIHSESLFTSDQAARLLTDPAMVMDISFLREQIPGPHGYRRTTKIVPCASGVAHGVLFWWELDLWNDISYSTQQGKEPWQDHWQQCLFVFDEDLTVRRGESIDLICSHTDDRICFALESALETDRNAKRSRVDESQPQSRSYLISPERAMQLNDKDRLLIIERAIHFALECNDKEVHFLDISDFSLCAMLAALQGASHVSSLETSSCEIPMTAARVSQANGLPRTCNGKVATYQILQCDVSNLTKEIFNNIPAEIVAGEPYYEVLEGWHLLEALNYFYILRSLRERGLVTTRAMSIPSHASIMICGIQCGSLAEAYQGCGDAANDSMICGFKHSDVKHYGDRYDQYGFTIRAFEYDYKPLTETREIARLCYDESNSIIGNDVETELQFESSGSCHGVLCWIEFGMHVGQAEELKFTTNNRHHRQLFQLLSGPAMVSEDSIGRTALVCRLKLGGIDSVEDYKLDTRVITTSEKGNR